MKGIELPIKAKADTKAIDNMTKSAKEFDNSLNDANTTAGKLGKTLTNAFQTLGIVGWVKAIKQATNMMINLSDAQTDYIESLNLLNVAYGDVNNSGKKLINTMSDVIGLDPRNLTKTLASYRQIADALGIADKNASLLAENLLQMTQDVSSLYNIDFSKASEKLTSAITGLYKRLARVKPIELLEHLIKGNQQLSIAF